MSNYCHFVGFDNCKFSEPKMFDYKYWVSVNYFLCDNDDPNFKLIFDLPEGYRLPTSEEFDKMVHAHPFFVKKIKDQIKGEFEEEYYGNKRIKEYKLDVYTFKNDLGLEVSVYNYDDSWSGFKYGPICLTKESYDEYYNKYNEPDKYNKEGQRYWNPTKDKRCAWYGEQCYDIAEKKYYENFDYRVPRCLILIKDPNKYELLG